MLAVPACSSTTAKNTAENSNHAADEGNDDLFDELFGPGYDDSLFLPEDSTNAMNKTSIGTTSKATPGNSTAAAPDNNEEDLEAALAAEFAAQSKVEEEEKLRNEVANYFNNPVSASPTERRKSDAQKAIEEANAEKAARRERALAAVKAGPKRPNTSAGAAGTASWLNGVESRRRMGSLPPVSPMHQTPQPQTSGGNTTDPMQQSRVVAIVQSDSQLKKRRSAVEKLAEELDAQYRGGDDMPPIGALDGETSSKDKAQQMLEQDSALRAKYDTDGSDSDSEDDDGGGKAAQGRYVKAADGTEYNEYPSLYDLCRNTTQDDNTTVEYYKGMEKIQEVLCKNGLTNMKMMVVKHNDNLQRVELVISGDRLTEREFQQGKTVDEGWAGATMNQEGLLPSPADTGSPPTPAKLKQKQKLAPTMTALEAAREIAKSNEHLHDVENMLVEGLYGDFDAEEISEAVKQVAVEMAASGSSKNKRKRAEEDDENNDDSEEEDVDVPHKGNRKKRKYLSKEENEAQIALLESQLSLFGSSAEVKATTAKKKGGRKPAAKKSAAVKGKSKVDDLEVSDNDEASTLAISSLNDSDIEEIASLPPTSARPKAKAKGAKRGGKKAALKGGSTDAVDLSTPDSSISSPVIEENNKQAAAAKHPKAKTTGTKRGGKKTNPIIPSDGDASPRPQAPSKKRARAGDDDENTTPQKRGRTIVMAGPDPEIEPSTAEKHRIRAAEKAAEALDD